MPAACVPIPRGAILNPNPKLAVVDGGKILVGGSPFTTIRLSPGGRDVVKGWLRGDPISDLDAHRTLAKRLVSLGMFFPSPPDSPTAVADLAVVIPVYNDSSGLQKTVASLYPLPIVVVDDGSDLPLWGPDDSTAPPEHVTVVSNPSNQGPAAARQLGARRTNSSVVAFVDAGVTITPQQLAKLRRWFDEPSVVAVAPRVSVSPAAHSVFPYETTNSPLDMGLSSSLVGPSHYVAYVPSTALMVKASALASVGGFDSSLRFGEDVDLVWRLGRSGAVIYDASTVVGHPSRRSLRALCRQRFGYGTSAGPLACRHPSNVAPVQFSAALAVVMALSLAKRPKLAACVWLLSVGFLGRKLEGKLSDPYVWATTLTIRSTASTISALARACRRDWWPFTLAVSLFGGKTLWRRVFVVALIGWVKPNHATGSVKDIVASARLAAADDLSYGAGVWLGAVRSRSARCLLPRVTGYRRGGQPTPTGK